MGIVEVPKTKTQVPADEADRIDALAHALADYFRRRVVVVRTDDKEVVIGPRARQRLDS